MRLTEIDYVNAYNRAFSGDYLRAKSKVELPKLMEERALFLAASTATESFNQHYGLNSDPRFFVRAVTSIDANLRALGYIPTDSVPKKVKIELNGSRFYHQDGMIVVDEDITREEEVPLFEQTLPKKKELTTESILQSLDMLVYKQFGVMQPVYGLSEPIVETRQPKRIYRHNLDEIVLPLVDLFRKPQGEEYLSKSTVDEIQVLEKTLAHAIEKSGFHLQQLNKQEEKDVLEQWYLARQKGNLEYIQSKVREARTLKETERYNNLTLYEKTAVNVKNVAKAAAKKVMSWFSR